jgi:uncharacterized protein YkwD
LGIKTNIYIYSAFQKSESKYSLFKTKPKAENDATGAEGDFEADCLKAHNEYREKHGVPPLKLNKKVGTLNKLL